MTDAEKGPDSSEHVAMIAEIQKAILLETKRRGRRMTAEEARKQYGYYGSAADEAIGAFVHSGIVLPDRQSHTKTIRTEEDREPSPGAENGWRGRKTWSYTYHFPPTRDAGFWGGGGENKDEKEQEAPDEEARQKEYRPKKHRAGQGFRDRFADFRTYKDELLKKNDKKKKGIVGEIIVFAVVNSFFWFRGSHSMMGGGGGVPWLQLLSSVWGLSVLESIVGTAMTSRQAREIEGLENLDRGQTRELKSINEQKKSVKERVFGTLRLAAIMSFVGFGLKTWVPWASLPVSAADQALIATLVTTLPVGISALVTVIKLISFLATNPRRHRKLFEAIRENPSPELTEEVADSDVGDLGAYRAIYDEAVDSANDIENELKKTDAALAAEISPELKKYKGQVLQLATSAHEIDRLTGEIPMEALMRDKAVLREKLAQASPALRKEYEGSIAEIEKQESSFKTLGDQKEIINLRLRSSVNQINQLRLDIAKTKAASSGAGTQGASALDGLHRRFEELARNAEDLNQGLEAASAELARDPFAELEKLSPPQAPDPSK